MEQKHDQLKTITNFLQPNRVGTNLAVEPTATGQQVVKQNPTGILTAPSLTASNTAPNPNLQTAKDGLSTGTSHLLIAAASIGNEIGLFLSTDTDVC